jgi:hypothetical protein
VTGLSQHRVDEQEKADRERIEDDSVHGLEYRTGAAIA